MQQDERFDYTENHTFPKDLEQHKSQFASATLDTIINSRKRVLGRVSSITKDRYSMFITTLDYSKYTKSIMREIYTNVNLCENKTMIPMHSYVSFSIAYSKRSGYYAYNVCKIVDGGA